MVNENNLVYQYNVVRGLTIWKLGNTQGSWTASAGVIAQEKQLDLLTLSGTNSIIGRAVVLHALPDSCDGEVSLV